MTDMLALPTNPDERPDDETLWERRHTAVTLRNAGQTFTQIGNALQISPAQARRDVERAVRDYMEGQLDMIIGQHRAILADIRKANYPLMLSGNRDAAKSILDGLTHEAKLLGMYAPTRVVTGVSEGEFSERFLELIEAVSPDTLKEMLSGTLRRKAADSTSDPDAPVDAEIVPEPVGTDDPDDGGQGDGCPGPDESEPTPKPPNWGGADDDDSWSNI